MHHILCACYNPSPRINSPSRTLLGLRTGPRRITITMKWCACLTLVHYLQTFHLMRQYKFVLTNCMPFPIHQHCGKDAADSCPLGIRALSFFIVLFCVFMDRDEVNMANIQPSWPHAWSITQYIQVKKFTEKNKWNYSSVIAWPNTKLGFFTENLNINE